MMDQTGGIHSRSAFRRGESRCGGLMRPRGGRRVGAQGAAPKPRRPCRLRRKGPGRSGRTQRDGFRLRCAGGSKSRLESKVVPGGSTQCEAGSSPRARVKAIIQLAAKAGRRAGRTTRPKTACGPRPPSAAASRRSRGRAARAGRKISQANGKVRKVWAKTKTRGESYTHGTI